MIPASGGEQHAAAYYREPATFLIVAKLSFTFRKQETRKKVCGISECVILCVWWPISL
jgi:hypothetical protein